MIGARGLYRKRGLLFQSRSAGRFFGPPFVRKPEHAFARNLRVSQPKGNLLEALITSAAAGPGCMSNLKMAQVDISESFLPRAKAVFDIVIPIGKLDFVQGAYLFV